MLAQVDQVERGAFVALDGNLFFSAMVSGDGGLYNRLLRLAKDGSSRMEADLRWPTSLLRSDGQDLFQLHGFGIDRIDPATLEGKKLFETPASSPLDMVAVDQHLYWLTGPPEHEGFPPLNYTPMVELWRGLKDGSGSVVQVGTVEAFTGALTEHDDELYFIAWCRAPGIPGLPVPRQAHIVKSTQTR